jgi:predicted Zn finger-like uncharacterized protein
MKIACPACKTEYTIADTLIGASGRTVRCAACKEQFFVATPVIDEARTAADASDPLATGKNTVETAEAKKTKRSIKRKKAPRNGGSLIKKAVLFLFKILRVVPAGVTAAIFCAVTLGGFVFERHKIVKTFPETAHLYAKLGMPVNLKGLNFVNIQTELVQEQNGSFLVVEGEIINPTADMKKVPKIALTIRDEAGDNVYMWTATPQRPTLIAGDRLKFRARLASPPVEGKNVLVRFGA